MSEDALTEEPVVETESDGKKKKPKAPKAKKRPSDFEIVRTILQRTSERKQAFLLKNIGEHSDVLFMCSVGENGFTYGSPELSIAVLEITDPELKVMVDGYLNKLYGLKCVDGNAIPNSVFSGFVCLRDQISELSKNKGESIDTEVHTNDAGSAWILRPDPKGKLKPNYYALAIESLFHVQLVKSYCESYRPLLDTERSDYLYYPYTHTNTETASIVTLPPSDDTNMLAKTYPNGFRAMVTKGLDVIMSKGMTGDFPYPVTKEEMVVFHERGTACQLVHRVTAEGWRMIMVRPNAVYFPTLGTHLPSTGLHSL